MTSSDPHPERAPLDRALAHSLEFLGSLEFRSVAATATLAELRARFEKPLALKGMDPATLVDELVRDADPGLIASAGGRFYGWVIGGGLPGSVAVDWLTSVWDQNAGLYATSPVAAVIEEVTGGWLKELLGLPASASFAFVTGCQMAHVTCLNAARHAVLARAGWDVGKEGLAGSPAIKVIASEAVHGTTTRALKMLGIGTAQMTKLPSAADYRLTPESLRAELAKEPDRPTIVVLMAGDVNCGVFDPFDTLIPIAKAAGAWVHIDGAMGSWAYAAPARRHLVTGIALADSWATDGHKWLNTPYDSGYAFVADAGAHRASLQHSASYLPPSAEARDEMDWTLEHSRRARGFATWAALRELGKEGVAELVERCCRHAHAIVTRIGALKGAEMVAEPVINQGLVRFLDPRAGATEADHDRRTDEVAALINATGEAFFTNTTFRGKRCMRVSVSSWRTTESDVDRAVQAAEKVLRG